jgi:hypothetical protein
MFILSPKFKENTPTAQALEVISGTLIESSQRIYSLIQSIGRELHNLDNSKSFNLKKENLKSKDKSKYDVVDDLLAFNDNLGLIGVSLRQILGELSGKY